MVLHTQKWNIYVFTKVLIDLIVTIFFSTSFRLILECFATCSDRNGLTAFKNIAIGSKLIIQTTLRVLFSFLGRLTTQLRCLLPLFLLFCTQKIISKTRCFHDFVTQNFLFHRLFYCFKRDILLIDKNILISFVNESLKKFLNLRWQTMENYSTHVITFSTNIVTYFLKN